jgi:hypothetical protein
VQESKSLKSTLYIWGILRGGGLIEGGRECAWGIDLAEIIECYKNTIIELKWLF